MTQDVVNQAVPERWSAGSAGLNEWMDGADDPRSQEPPAKGERETLLQYLRTYRRTLALKCAGLDAEQLARRSVPPSPMSLLGLVRHLTDVERFWFRRVMAGTDAPPLYWSTDVEDADWAGAVADPAVVADAWRAWREEVAFAEEFGANIPDVGASVPMTDGTEAELRGLLVHMIDEYARHCGHADLLRERVDGRVGQ